MNQPNQNDLRRLYLNALRKALAHIVVADGNATEAEISAFISVWRQATGESIDASTARAWCIEAVQDKLAVDAHFSSLAGVVNDAGKDLAFKAAFILCASDGALQRPEIDLLNQLGHSFQFDRERVARLIREINAAPPQATPRAVPPYAPRKKTGYAKLAVLLGIGLTLFSAVRYFIDRSLYQKGHDAYQQADCIEAIEKFDNVINGWRLGDFGGYADLSQQEKTECLPYQAAVDMQKNGEVADALVAYADFVKDHGESALAETARGNGTSLFEQNEPSALASQASCDKLPLILSRDLIPARDEYLPPFYFACGQVYDSAGNSQDSFAMFEALLTEYSRHFMAGDAEKALLANSVACRKASALQKNEAISNRADFMPNLYYNCGQTYEKYENWSNANTMFESLLTEYPYHSLAGDAETALLTNPEACERAGSLQKNEAIANRTDFMPRLYYNCGKAFEDDRDWSNAIAMYENFLKEFPDHTFATEMEAGLARAIIAQAKAAGAGEIVAPERSGSTGSGFAEVIIQNDSPERLRIVFSGPEARVEELEACSSCITYTGFGPLYCPEEGPIGNYTLQPGDYEVVVESISDTGVTPWTGTWTLGSGDEYSSCFFLVTTTFP